MRTFMGLALAVVLLLGTAAESRAQFSLAIGNPYIGQGYGSNLGGYGGGYTNAYGGGLGGYSNYSSTYTNTGLLSGPGVIGARNYGYAPAYAAPRYAYSSGYSGYAAPVAPAYGYQQTYTRNPLTGYQTNRYNGAYGYGIGSSDGFRPFRPIGRMFR